MSSGRVELVTQLLESKKYDVITEYASVDYSKKGKLVVSEYFGKSVRAWKDDKGVTRVLCPKNMSVVQEGHVANAIANGTIFDDADEVSRNAEMVEKCTLPINGMINTGKDVPKHVKPMIAIVIGRMGEDGTFDTETGRVNGVNFVKDLCCKGNSVNDVCDNYLEKEPEEFYGRDFGPEIHALKGEVNDIRDTEYDAVVSDDDVVDSYDDYDMEELETDPEDRDKDDDDSKEKDEDKDEDEESSDNESDDDEDDDAENLEGEDAEEEEMTQEAWNPYTNKELDEALTLGKEDLIKKYGKSLGESYLNKEWTKLEKRVRGLIKAGHVLLNVDISFGRAASQFFLYPKAWENKTREQCKTLGGYEYEICMGGGIGEKLHAQETKFDYNGSPIGGFDPIQESFEIVQTDDDFVQEGFLSKKPKKLKPIPRDVVAYITVEMNAIHSSNDQAMLAGYTCSKIELVDFYLTCIDTQDARYIVPHNKQYLEQMKKDLENLLAQILRIRPINRTEQIWRVNYPTT